MTWKLCTISKKRGISLIVCVSMMMILSVMAVTFSRLIVYEEAAVGNYVAIVDARLAAFAGIEKAKAILWESIRKYGYLKKQDVLVTSLSPSPPPLKKDDYVEIPEIIYPSSHPNSNPPTSSNWSNYLLWWSYPHPRDPSSATDVSYLDLETASRNRVGLSLYEGSNANYSYSGRVGSPHSSGKYLGRYEYDGNFYALKIVDIQGKLNVNSHIPEAPNPQRWTIANQRINDILKSLAQSCGIHPSEQSNVANGIRPGIQQKNPLVYKAMDKEPVKYRSIKEVEDVLNLVAPNSTKESKNRFLNNLCTQSWIDPTTSTYDGTGKNYYREQRAPVNVNTASRDLLKALIGNIRAYFLLYRSIVADISEPNYKTEGSAETMKTETQLEEKLYEIQIDFTGAAESIAERIQTRLNTSVFLDQADFEEFLESDNFVTALPALPPTNGVKNLDTSQIESDISWLTSGSYKKSDSNYNPYKAKWVQACRDALKSKFNPNSNISNNSENFNQPIYRQVTKDYIAQHTTEFCFSCEGRVEITSLGRVTARDQSVTVGKAIIRETIKMCDIMTHTTQQDFYTGDFFSGGNPRSLRTTSYPQNSPDHTNPYDPPSNPTPPPDSYVGWVEPITITQPPLSSSDKIMELTFNYTSAPPLINKVPSTEGTSVNNSNKVKDGLLSKKLLYRTGYTGTGYQYRYYTMPSIDKSGKIGTIQGRNVSQDNVYNDAKGVSKIGNYKGSIEFWVKLDVDGKDPMQCGLLSMTQISKKMVGKRVKHGGGFEDVDFREGTTTYLFKNALGKLRVSRIYFCGYFDKDGNYFGSEYLKDGDPQRSYGKRDILYDISHWEAHKWYHILLCWDDTQDLSNGLNLFVNGDKNQLARAQYYLGKKSTPGLPQFCVLNERSPANSTQIKAEDSEEMAKALDGIFLNGYYRHQMSKDDANVIFRYNQKIHSPGNATMDGVKTYSKSLYSTYKDSGFTRTRFQESKPGSTAPEPDPNATTKQIPNCTLYRNKFINTVQNGIVGPLRWVSYPRRKVSDLDPDNPMHPYVRLHKAEVMRKQNGSVQYPLVLSHQHPKQASPNQTKDDPTKPGYYGEGLPVHTNSDWKPDIVILRQDDEIQYTLAFSTPTSAGTCAALDSVSLLIVYPTTLLCEYLQ